MQVPDAMVVVVAIVPVKESNETHGPHPFCVYLYTSTSFATENHQFRKMHKRNWKKRGQSILSSKTLNCPWSFW